MKIKILHFDGLSPSVRDELTLERAYEVTRENHEFYIIRNNTNTSQALFKARCEIVEFGNVRLGQ